MISPIKQNYFEQIEFAMNQIRFMANSGSWTLRRRFGSIKPKKSAIPRLLFLTGRMARRVLMAEVSEGRVRGRPMLGWMDGVKVALGNRGMTVEAARQCAKDRKAWIALVHM